MQSASYQLFHSAKGSTWKKKDHKYIAIENGKYIYPEDVKKTSSKKPRKLIGSITDTNGNKVSIRGNAATKTIVSKSDHYDKASGERLTASQVAARKGYNSGNVTYGNNKVTPSEYRSLVAAGSKSINKDGTLRANSSIARGGDVQQAVAKAEADAKKKSSGSTRSSSRSASRGIYTDNTRSNAPRNRAIANPVNYAKPSGDGRGYSGQVRAKNSLSKGSLNDYRKPATTSLKSVVARMEAYRNNGRQTLKAPIASESTQRLSDTGKVVVNSAMQSKNNGKTNLRTATKNGKVVVQTLIQQLYSK